MKTLLNKTQFDIEESNSLQSLVKHLVAGIIPRAVQSNSFFLNDIPPGLVVVADKNLVGAVLVNLFNTVAENTAGSCINISAKAIGNIILVKLSDKNNVNSYTIENGLHSMQPIVKSIGGFVGITRQQKNETTIVFSFLNLPEVA